MAAMPKPAKAAAKPKVDKVAVTRLDRDQAVAQLVSAAITLLADKGPAAIKARTVAEAASLVKTITSGDPYSAVNATINYSYALANTGNITISSPSVTDTNVDAQPAYVSGDTNLDGKLNVGETWTFKASHTVTQADLDSGAVTNNATGVTLSVYVRVT